MTRARASWPITLIATSFGSGFLPRAPGTFGTLTAVPLAYALSFAPNWAFWLAAFLVTVIGTWAASRFCAATGTHDDQRIVVDEVAGYLVTLLATARTPVHLALAFVLFRLFDIWKPPPVRYIDDHVTGGFGVMADDLAAGVYGAAVLWLLDHFGVVAAIAARLHA